MMSEAEQQTPYLGSRPGAATPDGRGINLLPIFLSLVIISAVLVQFYVNVRKLEGPFFKQVFARPARLFDRYPEFQCCAHLHGVSGLDVALAMADQIVPPAQPVLFYSPVKEQVDGRVALYLATYLLYPRPILSSSLSGLNETVLNDTQKLGADYVFIYRAKEQDVVNLQLQKLAEETYLLNLKK